MYLENIIIKNIGPIDSFNYKFKFNNNNPTPLIVTGKNGKGKTIFTSYICDFFFELAKKAYDDAVEEKGAYFRIVGGDNIKTDCHYGYAIIESKHNNKELIYCEKTGNIDIEHENLIFLNPFAKDKIHKEFKESKNNSKTIFYNNLKVSKEESPFIDNVILFFPSYRSEKPNWMNSNAIKYNSEYLLIGKINRKINKEINADLSEERNELWLERLLSDAKCIVSNIDPKKKFVELDINQKEYVEYLINTKILNWVNTLLSKILREKNVKLQMNHRNSNSRISIRSSHKLIPSIKNLSLGESILFNMFVTILRHGDETLVGMINNLADIKGIVVVDEIDMHLDSDMQYSVLPELISMFPGIQFIITSHSPLFLLGMNNKFKSNCDFIEMPTGETVDVEKFDEFIKAYNYIKDSDKYNSDMKEEINKYLQDNNSVIPLIITEGETDWIHMKNAFDFLIKKDKEFAKDFSGLSFKFFEYSSDDKSSANKTVKMGDSNLVKLCKDRSILPNERKMIFIADNDKKEIKEELNSKENTYKNWGNNVFSFVIPVPTHRKQTPLISIEHYYTDTEIKTLITCDDNIKRRLFIGNEFNNEGISQDMNYQCGNKNKCGKNKINILDGQSDEKIIKIAESNSENPTNYGLSKKRFASSINSIKISDESYNNFKLIFNIIKEIINKH